MDLNEIRQADSAVEGSEEPVRLQLLAIRRISTQVYALQEEPQLEEKHACPPCEGQLRFAKPTERDEVIDEPLSQDPLWIRKVIRSYTFEPGGGASATNEHHSTSQVQRTRERIDKFKSDEVGVLEVRSALELEGTLTGLEELTQISSSFLWSKAQEDSFQT